MRLGNVDVPVLAVERVEPHLEIRVAAEEFLRFGEDGLLFLAHASCSSDSTRAIMFQ
jgi:hypothetical protein